MREKVLRIIRAAITEPGPRNLVEAYINALERDLGRVNEKAITDELTGLDNRRAFDVALKRMITRSFRIQVTKAGANSKPKSIFTCITRGWDYPISVIMSDIDHFKMVNDNFGHSTGDAALKFFADYLTANTTETDTIGRYGGEEFILALEGASHTGAFYKMEEIRKGIMEKPVTGDLYLKFSAGICSSEHCPEIVLLYSKRITQIIRDFFKGANVSKQLVEVSRRLRRKVEQVEQWFENIRTLGEEYTEMRSSGTLVNMLNSNRSDFSCFIMETRADQALYHAKNTGRNKVCIWTPEEIADTIR